MSGLKGALDDAYTHAAALYEALGWAVGACDDFPINLEGEREVQAICTLADDLASRISNLSNQLRS